MHNWFNIPVPPGWRSTHGVTEKANLREVLILFQTRRLSGMKIPDIKLKGDG